MTSFVQVVHPTEHPAIVRAGRAADSIRGAARYVVSARGAASMLLAAIVSAMLVAANQIIDTWSEGHLLLAWIVMWTVAFAALGLAAGPARSAVRSVRLQLREWAAARHAADQDAELWRLALTDARMMADISRAMSSDAAARVKRYS